MKNNVSFTVHDRLYIEDVERWINQKATEQQARARAHAQSLAAMQLPNMAGGDKLNDHFGVFTSAFDSIMSEADTKIGASYCISEANQAIEDAKIAIGHVNDELAEVRVESITTKTARDKMPKHDIDRRSVILAQLALLLISGAEMVVTALALSIFAQNLLFAILMAAGIWAGLHISAVAIPVVIHKIKNKKGKIIAGALFACAFVALFLGLGVTRMSYFNEVGGSGDVGILGALLFTMLNVFLFGCCIFIVHKYIPSRQVRKEIRERAQMDAKVAEIDKRIKDLENRKIVIDTEKREKLGVILQRMSYSKRIEDQIRERYHEVFEAFKQESILRRKGVAPCLSETPKPLKGFSADFVVPTGEGVIA